MRCKVRRRASCWGIGVGVPGLIDSETGRLVESPNLPGWSDYDVKGEIERRLGTTVILENDANAAAVGEQWLGAGRELCEDVHVHAGNGGWWRDWCWMECCGGDGTAWPPSWDTATWSPMGTRVSAEATDALSSMLRQRRW